LVKQLLYSIRPVVPGTGGGVAACEGAEGGQEEGVFDPLTVDYVRDHCSRAQETERRALAHAAQVEHIFYGIKKGKI